MVFVCIIVLINNNVMSNYLDKYHLKKVEPVKSRNKLSYQEYLKSQQKIQKVNLLKTTTKRKIPSHKKYFQKEEEEEIKSSILIQSEKSNKKIEANPSIRFNVPHQNNFMSPQPKIHYRSHKSLNFKSAKDNNTGTKILISIQGFFHKIMSNTQNGCTCRDPCPWSQKFFRWVDVPLQIIKGHYIKLLMRWQQSIERQKKLIKSNASIELFNNKQQSTREFQENVKNLKQIIKDIDRTQSGNQTFRNLQFKAKLKNILMNYAVEDPKIGYVQGMNLILSGILYHVKDQIKTYAIFRNIIMIVRGVYLNSFKECYQHIQKIKSYLESHVHDLYELFQEQMVDLNIVCLPWVLSLLTCIVPLDYLHLIYQGFINERWQFFYKMSLSILIYHKERFLQAGDGGDILVMVSSTNENRYDYDWQDIITYSKTILL